jgi:hypothetical protein
MQHRKLRQNYGSYREALTMQGKGRMNRASVRFCGEARVARLAECRTSNYA